MRRMKNVELTGRDNRPLTSNNEPLTVARLLGQAIQFHSLNSDPKLRGGIEQSRIANRALDEIEAGEKSGVIEMEDGRWDLISPWVDTFLQNGLWLHWAYVKARLDALALPEEAPKPPALESNHQHQSAQAPAPA
mgnify:CR=1 FL=1